MAERAAATVLAEEFGGPVPLGVGPEVGPEVGGAEMDVTGPLDLVAVTLIASFCPS